MHFKVIFIKRLKYTNYFMREKLALNKLMFGFIFEGRHLLDKKFNVNFLTEQS